MNISRSQKHSEVKNLPSIIEPMYLDICTSTDTLSSFKIRYGKLTDVTFRLMSIFKIFHVEILKLVICHLLMSKKVGNILNKIVL